MNNLTKIKWFMDFMLLTIRFFSALFEIFMLDLHFGEC
ncbi:hypothetical protein PULV_a3155 [Pseudoalteromonas ulvae UL12]|nr:hypothetical protein [Pseudoalteromonas ulvae UL12]